MPARALRTRARSGAKRALLRTFGRFPVRAGLTILLYHQIEPAFFAQVRALLEVGTILDEDRVLDRLLGREPWPTSPEFWITFDDGYPTNHTDRVHHQIAELGIRPHLFLVAGNALNRAADSPALMCREHARAAIDAGWTIGSHTTSHWNCSQGSDAELRAEIIGSKALIEEQLRVEVRTFAYPYGTLAHRSDRADALVREAGYSASFLGLRGVQRDRPKEPYVPFRQAVDDHWSPVELLGCINGALDRLGSG